MKKGVIILIIIGVIIIIGAGIFLLNNPENQDLDSNLEEKLEEIIVGSQEKYVSIHAAVNDASPGDTILVKPGIYNENVKIYDSLDSLSLIAQGNVILNPADLSQPGILVNADNVIIEGLTVEKGLQSGIYLHGAKNCTIRHNSINFNTWGIVLRLSNECTIINNSAINNTGYLGKEEEKEPAQGVGTPSAGIQLINSKNNTIQENLIIDNPNGIDVFYDSADNIISGNIIRMSVLTDEHSRYNNGIGTFAGSPVDGTPRPSNGNIIRGNSVSNYNDCIDLAGGSSDTTIINNIIFSCNAALPVSGSNNLIENNTIRDNNIGIILTEDAHDCRLNDNSLINNNLGIRFINSNGHIIDGCLMKQNEIDICSENSSNQVRNCQFKTHDKDSNSLLEVL